MTYKFGDRMTLSDGSTPVLLDFCQFSDGKGKAFVEHDTPRPWGVDGKTVIGHTRRLWVDAPGFVTVRDRDGVKAGIDYKDGVPPPTAKPEIRQPPKHHTRFYTRP